MKKRAHPPDELIGRFARARHPCVGGDPTVSHRARLGASVLANSTTVESRFGYDLHARLDQIRPTYRFDETCQGTVPQALAAFLESTSFEDAIRNPMHDRYRDRRRTALCERTPARDQEIDALS